MHTHLTRDDRVRLSALLRAGFTQAACAGQLGVNPSTISREVARVTRKERYDASLAQRDAQKKRRESKQKTRIKEDRNLQRYVVGNLKKGWSPDEIAGRWKFLHGGTFSHQTIYDWVRYERKDLIMHLPYQGRKRRTYGSAKEKSRYQAAKRSITERPAVVEARSRLGDWEGDTIVGKERTQRILTHVERVSLYLVADKLDTATSDNVHERTAARMRNLPCETITYDNGSEFALHRYIEKDTGAAVYFAHPGSPHERGSNENTNGQLRRFFPKRSRFATITQRDVDRAVRLLNHRPRKSLGYLTPYEVFKHRCVSGWNLGE